MKKLILIDDHKMLRKGITSFIKENSDWQVVAEAESLNEIPELVKQFHGSDDKVAAIVDIQLKGDDDGEVVSNGFEAVKLFSSAGIPSIIFSSHDTGACIERAMSNEVGAKGFVSKCSDERMLLDALNSVAEGKSFIQPDLISGFLETHSLFAMLTKREQQVVKLIESGLSNDEIANELDIKTRTLENYITVIYDKLGCKDRTALIRLLR